MLGPNFRDYQIAAIESIYTYFASHPVGNPVIAMPTGTGKSYVIAGFIQSVMRQWPGQRFLMLTHDKKLIEQNAQKLRTLWPSAPLGIHSAGLGDRDTAFPIIFGGIRSVLNTAKKGNAFGHRDLVIIDEAHMLSPKQTSGYQHAIELLSITNPNLRVIGLTATPYRTGLGPITQNGIFTDICFDITSRDNFVRLIAEGHLCFLKTKKTSVEIDVSKIKINRGEYDERDINAKLTDKLLNKIIDEIIEQGSDRAKWLIFAAGIENAEKLNNILLNKGIRSAVCHSKLTETENDANQYSFETGKIQALVNNNMFTTGFDCPQIDLIAVIRPTTSVVLWVQMLGRGTRPAIGKSDCLVLDFSGNVRRLGPINDPILPQVRGNRLKPGSAPVRVCPECQCYSHLSAKFCDLCGFEFPRQNKLTASASTEHVIAFDGLHTGNEIYVVDKVIYSKYQKPNKPPTVQATYFCGQLAFKEWICPEHDGYPKIKAKKWMQKRVSGPWNYYSEFTVDNFISMLNDEFLTKTPKKIIVSKISKYPEIINYEF